MPKLLAFLPCERVLVDPQRRQQDSLIGVLTDITVILAPDEIPKDAALPISWQIFTLWQREPGDEEKLFEQRCELRSPDGVVVLDAPLQFKLQGMLQKNVINVTGFPVAPRDGLYSLVLSIGEANAGRLEVASFPISLRLGAEVPASPAAY